MPRLVTAIDPNTGDAVGVDLDDLENDGGAGISNDAPVGAINGVNKVFVFTSPPVAVFYQKQLQDEGDDYTLVGSTVTFVNAPVSGTVRGLV